MTSVRRQQPSPQTEDHNPAQTPLGEMRRPMPFQRDDAVGSDADAQTSGVARRGFLSWAIAAPTLMVGTSLVAGLVDPKEAEAKIPAVPEPADEYDLGDLQDDAALPTSNLITITVDTRGIAHFALPRAEVGQGITTSTAMIIAEELDMKVSRVRVTLANARPELLFNQLTGGSNTTTSTYTAIRTAASIAKLRLMTAAASKWGVSVDSLSTSEGVVKSATGKTATYGSLATAAAAVVTTIVRPQLKATEDFTVLGKPYKRTDALDAVTGKKVFTLDLNIPNALPTMICRPPTLNGTPKAVLNATTVKNMPGVTDVAMISTGVAVRAATFGQCIDGIRALKVDWNAGTEDRKNDGTVLAELRAAELPLAVPSVPVLATTVEGDFTFYFRSNTPLESDCAVADVRANSIQIWSPLKVPIVLQEDLATKYSLPVQNVKVHVMTGGGSFGRHLFSDAALEAAEASKAMGKPVKLMWSRTDDFRQGRAHPMCTSRVRATYLAGNVLTYEQRVTSVSTDFTHGLGEILTAFSSRLPAGNYTFAQSIFLLTQTVSYDYGVTTQLLNEVDMGFNTGSMRNIYSPDARTAQELITDQLAKVAGKDRMAFRKEFVKDPRGLAVLEAVEEAGEWGRKLPHGVAQGIAVHNEYKGWCAALVELDNRPATVNRDIVDAYTGPRVTKVTFAVDVGLCLNPLGLEAQMQGGIMDGIAQALTSSMHLRKGVFLEGSWDNYYYTRQWNVPDVNVIIMPPTGDKPGGAGEFGVAATMAATATAYGAAIGRMPTSFPINHNRPLGFDIIPNQPSTPQSPTDGLIHDVS